MSVDGSAPSAMTTAQLVHEPGMAGHVGPPMAARRPPRRADVRAALRRPSTAATARTGRALAALLPLAALAGCAGDSATEPGRAAASALSVSPSEVVLPFFGDEMTFSAAITDRRGAALPGEVTWSSEAPEVFSVTPGGVVTGLSDGTGILRATFGGLRDSAVVTVAPAVSQFSGWLAHDTEQDNLAGITAAIARDGEVLWSRAFGWADLERQIPAARETIYKVGSISKTVTAALMAALTDDGIVSLDTPLAELVPEIEDIRDRPSDADPALPMLRHLANHTSGLADLPELPDASTGHVSIWKSKLLASIPTIRYRTPPGQAYHYSNVGYALLGPALERAANHDFVEQVHMRIFEPMGMTSSTYLVDQTLQARLATGYYNRPGQPVNTEYPLRQHANSGYRVPGGGAYSTVDDLARFAAGVMGRGGRELFSHTARAEMLSVQTPGGGRTGAGFGIFLGARGERVFASHGGTAAGYRAYLIFEPATGLTVILLRNSNWGLTDLRATARWLISNLPGN